MNENIEDSKKLGRISKMETRKTKVKLLKTLLDVS